MVAGITSVIFIVKLVIDAKMMKGVVSGQLHGDNPWMFKRDFGAWKDKRQFGHKLSAVDPAENLVEVEMLDVDIMDQEQWLRWKQENKNGEEGDLRALHSEAIHDWFDKFEGDVKDALDKVRDVVHDATSEAKEKTEKVIEKIREKTEEVKENVDEVVESIKEEIEKHKKHSEEKEEDELVPIEEPVENEDAEISEETARNLEFVPVLSGEDDGRNLKSSKVDVSDIVDIKPFNSIPKFDEQKQKQKLLQQEQSLKKLSKSFSPRDGHLMWAIEGNRHLGAT